MSLNRSVAFRSRVRTVRRLAAVAAALVLTLSLAAPVQAAPAGPDGAPLSSVWAAVQGWLGGFLGLSPDSPADEGPVPLALPEGCEMDPSGSTCESTESQDASPSDPEDPPGFTSG